MVEPPRYQVWSNMQEPHSIQGLFDCQRCKARGQHRFCSLTDSAMQAFDAIGSRVDLGPGARIFSEESVVDGVFVLCKGRVKLSTTSRQGKTMILRIAQSGDLLGLSAVLSSRPYEVTADTLETTHLKKIGVAQFRNFLSAQGEASVHAAQEMSSEYRSTFFDVKRMTLCTSASARLASLLIDWIPTEGDGGTAARMVMPLSHEELGNLIGSSRETVTRTLSRFKQDKLISIRGVQFDILSLDRLRAIATE